ncbi:translation elongation factor-like protein [Candidatus Pacearchaeota archaeon]|nr:translation elongation factor-like protein [Candidatus Pacearchaeota archaeon]
MSKEIGKITHYFDNIGVAVIQLKGNLKVGDKIHVKGTTTDFTQEVDSMQVNHKPIQTAKKGDDVGMQVSERVRPNDKVFLAE